MRYIPHILIRLLFYLLGFTVLLFIGYRWIFTKKDNEHYSMESYEHCLLDVYQALDSLSIPWFLTFSSALMYWRSKNFISNDIDIGIFEQDLQGKNFNDKKFISIMRRKYNFKLRNRYGKLNHGKEWSFSCPKSNIPLDIFIFYPLIESNQLTGYWSATYNGLCNEMKFKKCRWKHKNFNLRTFEMFNTTFSIVPLEFIIDRYGKDYKIPKQFSYLESLKILPNLIEESR